MEHFGGVSPAWPFSYDEFEPWYSKAEQLFRCAARWARIRPSRSTRSPMPSRRCPTRRRSRAPAPSSKGLGLHPSSLPLGVDIDTWLKEGKTRLGRLSRTPARARWTPRPAPLAAALKDPNIRLETGAEVDAPRSRRRTARPIDAIHYRQNGETKNVSPKLVILVRRRGQFRRHPAALAIGRSARASPTAPTRSAAIS